MSDCLRLHAACFQTAPQPSLPVSVCASVCLTQCIGCSVLPDSDSSALETWPRLSVCLSVYLLVCMCLSQASCRVQCADWLNRQLGDGGLAVELAECGSGSGGLPRCSPLHRLEVVGEKAHAGLLLLYNMTAYQP